MKAATFPEAGASLVKARDGYKPAVMMPDDFVDLQIDVASPPYGTKRSRPQWVQRLQKTHETTVVPSITDDNGSGSDRRFF